MTPHHYRLFSIFVFLAPLLFFPLTLLPEGNPGSISWLPFAAFTGGELLLSLLFQYFYGQKRITRKKFLLIEYQLRTVFGLPLTVYFAVTAPHPFVALLRFLPALLLLGGRLTLIPALWHASFFFLGTIVFAVWHRRAWPVEGQWAVLVFGVILTSSFLLGRYSYYRLRREGLMLERRMRRTGRNLNGYREKERQLVTGHLPGSACEPYNRGERKIHERGTHLLVGIAFTGNHESLNDFQNAAEFLSPDQGLDTFCSRWDGWLDTLTGKMEGLGLTPAANNPFRFYGRLLEAEIAVGREERDAQWARLWKEVYGVLFGMYEILALEEGIRHLILGRGRRPWSLQVAVGLGEVTGLLGREVTPAWHYYGLLVSELERFLMELPAVYDARAEEGRMWLHPSFAGRTLLCFREEEIGRRGEWISPGALRPQFSRDDTGKKPHPDFFERMKYEDPGLI